MSASGIPQRGGEGNRNDRDRVLEHCGKSADLVDAPLNVHGKTLVPKVGQRAVKHQASRGHGKVTQEIAKVVTQLIETPPPSTLMMAGHLLADDGKTAGMAWSDRKTTFLPPPPTDSSSFFLEGLYV